MKVFRETGPVSCVFGWDEDVWTAEFNILTLAQRKDIARICRVNPPAEWPQKQLELTLSNSLIQINKKRPTKHDWEKEIFGLPESLVTELSDAYREARLAPATPPDNPVLLAEARTVCDAYLESPVSFVAEEEGSEIFSLLAPIPRYVWWAGEFYLVHFHILTLDERRIIARLLDLIPVDQVPHVEVQHTLARSIYAVNGVPVSASVGATLDLQMDWVDEFPESLIALLAGQYDSAKSEPRGLLYGMLPDPNSESAPSPPIG